MLMNEHNAYWGVKRKPEDTVCCNTLVYGELSQYDPECPACWLGHRHTWAEHDAWIGDARSASKKQEDGK